MPLDLTQDERQALINLLTREVEGSKFPLSPRIQRLKAIRAKLQGEPGPVTERTTPRRRQ